MKKRILLIVIIVLGFNGVNSFLARGSDLFTTWDGLEADKLAAIWLIQRFISPGATIKFYPQNYVISDGIQFDTPFARMKQKFNQSAFESLLSHYRIVDPNLNRIACFIHDIEINVWEKKKYLKTMEIEFFFTALLTDQKERDQILKESNEFFDHLYDEISSQESSFTAP